MTDEPALMLAQYPSLAGRGTTVVITAAHVPGMSRSRAFSAIALGLGSAALVTGVLLGAGTALAYPLPPVLLLLALVMRRDAGERMLLPLMARNRRRHSPRPGHWRCRR